MNLKKFYTGRAIGFTVLLVVLGVVVGFYALNSYIYEEKQAVVASDHKNAEYVIEGTRVQFVNGTAQTPAAPGSASMITTKYFGNELVTDLNDDGREDIVFLITQDMTGSGNFYYVVAALNTERGYIGSSAMLLGDRIAPQTTEKGKGKIIIVNYADRAPGEPFSTQPSVGKSMWLIFDANAMQFGEVQKNFEGEADPLKMTLSMKKWVWISALYNDERELKPNRTNAFTLTFNSDGKFSATTDCNSMGGTYTATAGIISFSNIFQTEMYCEGSQESDFAKLLENASGYHFTSRGELILDLKFDSGSVIFR